MTLNVCQLIILLGLLQGVIYITLLSFLPTLRTKANFFLALLILAFMGNLGQYWLRDVGLISDYTLQLIFMPWQLFIAPFFWFYVRALRVFNLRPAPHYYLWIPIGIIVLGHLFIKGYLLFYYNSAGDFPIWISTFNLAEECISMAYCLGVSIAAFRTIRIQKQHSNYQGFGINQRIIKWILPLVYLGLVLCVMWLTSILLFDKGSLSNYYILWIFSVVVLNVLGLNGIYNSLEQGAYKISTISTGDHEGDHPPENKAYFLTSNTLSVASPMKYFDQRLMDALITLSHTLSKITDVDALQDTFRKWILKEFDIASIAFTHTVSSNELKGIAQMSEDQQELTVPYRNMQRQLGSFTVRATDDNSFHQRYLYYLKMAAKAYSFHLGQLAKRPILITADNPHYQSLLALMKVDQLYLDSELDLGQVAERLNISEGYLSKMVNKITGLGFSEWVNTYRIDHAKRLMSDKTYSHFSITGYGYEAGFNSKSTFYKAFAKIVGQSPGAYKNELEQGSRSTMY